MTTVLFYSTLDKVEVENRLDALNLEGLERVLVGRGPLPNDRDVFVRVQDDFRTPADLQMEARTMVQTTYYPENCPHYKEILLKVYGQLEDPAIRGTMCQVFSIDDL